MVWLKLIISFFIILTSVNASELSKEEITYFKIIDLNNDGFVSIDEINQSTGIIFQLIDKNNDNNISKDEIIELKNIIEMFS